MTFDYSISDEVSLSKILDVFIKDNEKSDIVLSYLRNYDNSFSDILEYSQYSDRIFQLDFFLSCSPEDQVFIITKLKETSLNNAATLTWQILKSESKKAQSVKYILRNELQWILQHGPRHPYSNRHESYIASIDSLCFKLAEQNRIADLPLLNDSEEFRVKLRSYFKYFEYSLFHNRLMQYDFFANLDDVSKYFFIKETFNHTTNIKILRNFTIQVLDSDETVEVKICCLDELSKILYFPTDVLDVKTLDVIKKCKSFSEMMLKFAIFNSNISHLLVLYLLLFNPKWAYEWAEYDKDELDKNLKVSDLIFKELNYKK